MKDNLFELLLTLFEKTLSQLKETHTSEKSQEAVGGERVDVNSEEMAEFIKSAQNDSIRVFSHDEQIKLTKPSYQFLMRMSALGIISPDVFELIINHLIFSSSRFVDLQETKWTIRNTLASSLDFKQLAFLDLVLYHREDELPLH